MGLDIRRYEITDNFLRCDHGFEVVLENALTLRRSLTKYLEIKHYRFYNFVFQMIWVGEGRVCI